MAPRREQPLVLGVDHERGQRPCRSGGPSRLDVETARIKNHDVAFLLVVVEERSLAVDDGGLRVAAHGEGLYGSLRLRIDDRYGPAVAVDAEDVLGDRIVDDAVSIDLVRFHFAGDPQRVEIENDHLLAYAVSDISLAKLLA